MSGRLKKLFKIPSLSQSTRVLRLLAPDPILTTLLVIFIAIVFFFYSTNFRRELEHFFHDTRTNLMPPSKKSNVLQIIAIDDNSIAKLEPDRLRLRLDTSKKPYLSLKNLTLAAGILANTEAKSIVLLIPEHVVPTDDPDLSELIEIIKYDPRFIIGTTGYNQLIPNMRTLPPALEAITDQVAAAETFRSRSNAIVRSLPFLSYRGSKETINLPPKVAGLIRPNSAVQTGNYQLKFEPIDHFPSLAIADLITEPQKFMDDFAEKVVVVGYTSPRSVGIQTTEQPFTNTPLTGYAPTNLTGVSTTYLMANAIENLLLQENLKAAPPWLTFLQTILVAVCCFFAWELGGLLAVTSVLLMWIFLLIGHAALYRWASLWIPLADTFLATAIVSIWSAFRRLREDLRRLADQKVSTEIKSELAKFQSHFLHGFSTWLTATTETITGLVESARNEEPSKNKHDKLFERVFLAAADLTEYLSGINQLSKIDELDAQDVLLESFDLESTLNTILRRFDAKSVAKNIAFSVSVDLNAKYLTSNQYFVDAILYNFISNAVKYSHNDSIVEIRVYKETRGQTILSVSDDGPGISPELQERVFERFYRINDERIYSAKGSGIGLYLCKFFAESLGGKVELISEVGKGSEFRAIIP
ncbi:MAG: ATP-binding protein [bacterium]